MGAHRILRAACIGVTVVLLQTTATPAWGQQPQVSASLSGCGVGLAACGLTAEVLLVADQAAQVNGIVARICAAEQERQRLSTAIATAAELATTSVQRRAGLGRNPSDSQLREASRSAEQAAAAARQELDAAKAAIWAVAAQELASEAVRVMRRTQRMMGHGLPPEFGARELTAAEIKELRTLLAKKQRLERDHRVLGSQEQQRLAQFEDSAVLAARARLIQQSSQVSAELMQAGSR